MPEDKGLYDHGSLNPAPDYIPEYREILRNILKSFLKKHFKPFNLILPVLQSLFYPPTPTPHSSLCDLRQSEPVVLTGGATECK